MYILRSTFQKLRIEVLLQLITLPRLPTVRDILDRVVNCVDNCILKLGFPTAAWGKVYGVGSMELGH